MKDYIAEMVLEKANLDARIERLKKIINSDIVDTFYRQERDLIIRQVEAMKKYSRILGLRIKKG